MASNLRVDTILPSTGLTLGIGTASGTINFLGNSNIVTTGNVSIGGTLTYEDVTNVDSVGVITARSGIDVTSGNIAVSSNGVTVSPSGFDFKIRSNTGKLGIHIDNASGTPTLEFGIGGATGGAITTNSTGPIVLKPNNSERLRITHNGEIGIGGANYGTSGQVLTSQGSGSAVQWATPSSITTAGGTMTLGFQDHVAGAVSSTTPTAYYQRIGNMVFCSCDTGAINLSGLNNSQILLVTGCFPITRDNNWTMVGSAYQYTVTSNQNSGGATIVPTMGYWLSNTSLYFVIPRVSSTADNMTVGMCNSNNTRIFMQWHYKVN